MKYQLPNHCAFWHVTCVFMEAMKPSLGVWRFVLFNDAWSLKRHSASNTTVTRIKLFITSITITYYHHFPFIRTASFQQMNVILMFHF